MADALRSQAEVEANVEASLRDDLARLKLSVSAATKDNVTLAGLEREAKAQRDLLENYLARYNEAVSQTDASSALPDVRVVTLAAPAVQPASPKTALILAAVGFVALALQVGVILFGELMSGRALTPRVIVEEADEVTPTELSEEAADVEAMADDVEDGAADVAEFGGAAGEEEAGEQPIVPDQALPEPGLAAGAGVEPEVLEPNASLAVPAEPALAAAAGKPGFGNLVEEIVSGRVRVVALAALGGFRECLGLGPPCRRLPARRPDRVLRRRRKLSHDPGAGPHRPQRRSCKLRRSRPQGERGARRSALGALPILERRSMKPATLIEALTDIYDVVIVTTGRMGLTSTLPVFAGIDCRLVLVGDDLGATPCSCAR